MSAADFAAVVAANWRRTTGYIVAGSEPCVTIGREEVQRIERRLVRVELADVGALRPRGSWFMAVIICPGDDLGNLAQWAQETDASRVHFYLHARARPTQLAPWRDAGLPLDHVDVGVRTWGSLHKMLGWDLNIQVYTDHRTT